ncbi:MAG: hypothetical protein ACQEQC_05990 [Elusimicrobiota bacterium]
MIKVKSISETEFKVEIIDQKSEEEYRVTLDKDYYQKLTKGKKSPEDLIKDSFEFLLKRESKEMIISRFNLKVISKYFPEYEEKIKS